MGMFTGTQFFIRLNTISGNRNHLSWLNISYKLSAHRGKCTALRCKYISIIAFSKTQWFQSKRIPDTNQFSRTHDNESISTFQLTGSFEDSLFYCFGVHSLTCYMKRNNFRISRCMKNRSVLNQLPFQFRGIDQVSVMCQCKCPFNIGQYQRLCIFCYRCTCRRITYMSDSEITFHIPYGIFPENFTYQSQILMELDITTLSVCSGNCKSARLLSTMLK